MTRTQNINNFVASLGASETFLVGGSVRDQKLGRRSKDSDFVVRGIDLKTLRARARAKGADVTNLKLRDGRVVGIRANKRGLGLLEIALPRTDRKIPFKFDGGNERHQFEIIVDPSITIDEDAKRRDFTINALFQNVKTGEVFDPTGLGLSDLETRLIRTTHESSFADDPLRILRALRFVSVLGFDLAPETEVQMRKHARAVTGLTGKGVSGTALDEFCKLLMGDHVAKALRIARDMGVLSTFVPELAPMLGFDQNNEHHDLTTDEHTFTALDVAAKMGLSLRVRMALLFHDSGKPESSWMGKDGRLHFFSTKLDDGTVTEDHAVIGARLARKFLARVNADNALRRDVPRLIERHMVPLTMKVRPTKVRQWRCDLGDDLLEDLLKHRLADCMGKTVIDNDALRAIERMEKIREEAVRLHVPASPKDLKDKGLITGHDLIAMGVKGGRIGEILDTLLHEVVSQPERGTREHMLKRAEKLAGQK